MKKELPVVMPDINSYQYLAYPLSIILADGDLKNWYYNNYIQLSIRKDFFYHDGPDFTFYKSSFENIDLFNYSIIDKNMINDKVDRMIEESVMKDEYVYLLGIDDYYIKCRNLNRHIFHDVFIYGFEDDMYHCMLYVNGKFTKTKIPKNEIIMSIQSTELLEKDCWGLFLAIKKARGAYVPIDIKYIKEQLISYMNSEVINVDDVFSLIKHAKYANKDYYDKYKIINKNLVFGVSIYGKLIEYIECVQRGEIYADSRVFKVFYEHKSALYDKVNNIKAMVGIDEEIIKSIAAVRDYSDKLRMMTLRYAMERDGLILERAIDQTKHISDLESECITKLVRIL